jgi:hypothetical protein
MKKLFLLFAGWLGLSVMLSAEPAIYLVQLGTLGTPQWSEAAKVGKTLINLNNPVSDFSTWFNAASLAEGDQVWLAGGEYLITATITLKPGVSIYGSFTGTETAVGTRVIAASGKPWDFVDQTVLKGNNADIALFSGADNTNLTFLDGFLVTDFGATVNRGNAGAIGSKWVIKNCNFLGARLTISDAQILNSSFSGNDQILKGGAVDVILTGANLLIKGVTFENNKSTAQGGVINIASTSTGRIENCVFKGNSGLQGGAIGIVTTTESTDTIKISSCEFTGNSATVAGTSAFGSGALFMDNANSKVIIKNCTFAGNTTLRNGGAIGTNNGKLVVLNSVFRNNKAGNYGAAIHGNNAFECFIANSIFTNNEGNGILRLIHATSLGVYVYNSTFANNSASDNIATGGTLVAKIKNCIFFGNTKTFTGVNVESDYNATDAAFAIVGQDAHSKTGITAGNTFVLPTTFAGAPTTGEQSAESAAASWKLKAGSPAVDAGTLIEVATGEPAAVVWRNDLDIIGVARTMGGVPDIGAYELVQSGPTSVNKNEVGKLNVYPSLTLDVVNIETEVSAVHLFDLNGRNIGNWKNTRQIDISDRAAGIYILQLNHNGEVMNYRIVKK